MRRDAGIREPGDPVVAVLARPPVVVLVIPIAVLALASIRPHLVVISLAMSIFCRPAAAAVCAGDCSGNGAVGIDELVLSVNIALDRGMLEQCLAIDADRDQRVTVGELVGAVNSALHGCPAVPPPRLIAVSREGRIASLDLASPWTPRASSDLAATTVSARCRAGRCLLVHPAPVDSISIVAADDLTPGEPIALEPGDDPRDVALVDERTAVVGRYGRAELLEVDLVTREVTPIDLSPLADGDGLPEPLRMAACGRRVFVQLRRVEHGSGILESIGAVLAVIDLDRPANDRIVDVDPETPGPQAIRLAARPDFDMPVDCAGGVLYLAEPAPLMQGGGAYEQVDLNTFTASELAIDTGAEVGGFEVVAPPLFWLITHTEFGPGPSSHLSLIGGPLTDTHNTFAREHVNDLVFDAGEDLLFYPDPCTPGPANQSCDTGIHVFHAHSGAHAAERAIKVGFEPIEVTVSR